MKASNLFYLILLLISFSQADAQTTAVNPDAIASSILQDYNSSGAVTIAAFGDSITRGEGDFRSPDEEVYEGDTPRGEAGYPLRIETYLGVPVSNLGSPGEDLVFRGVTRFIATVPGLAPDIVVISEGANDGRIPSTPGEYFRAAQTMLNLSHAIGIRPVLATIPPPCCGHGFLTRFVESYNQQTLILAAANNVPLANVHHAFLNTCGGDPDCPLLNRPEGLHPNIQGYDVMGEVIMAALLNINIFASDGPLLLAQALGLPATAIRTVPDPAPAAQ